MRNYQVRKLKKWGVLPHFELYTSRKRVVASFTKATAAGSIVSASYYNYDINGNDKTLWQENSALNWEGYKMLNVIQFPGKLLMVQMHGTMIIGKQILIKHIFG